MTVKMHEFVVHPTGAKKRDVFIPLSLAAMDIFFGILLFLSYLQNKSHWWLYMSITSFWFAIILGAIGITALQMFLAERGRWITLDNKNTSRKR